MEYENDQLVAEKRPHDGEEKISILEDKKLWIPFGKISWAAIFAGVLVITVSQMLFSLLGMGIGIANIAPLQEQNPAKGLGAATLVWWTVTMLVSLFLGGLTAGKMYQTRSKTYLTWHGLLTWSTFTVFSFFMLSSSVGMLVSGTGNIIGSVATASASLSKESSPDISRILNSAQGLSLNPVNNGRVGSSTTSNTEQGLTNQDIANPNTGVNNTQPRSTIANNNVGSSVPVGAPNIPNQNISGQPFQNRMVNTPFLINDLRNFFTGENSQNTDLKENLVNTLVNQNGMNRVDANNQVDQWIASYEELKANAKIQADKAAKVISTTAIIGFFALLLGAVVTIWGARVAPMREYALAKK